MPDTSQKIIPDSEEVARSSAELRRARELLDRDELQESEAAYRRVVTLSVHVALARYGLGVISLKRNDVTAAETEFQRCIAIGPEYPEWLGHSHALETQEAVANAYYYLGEIWDKRGEADVSLGFYRKALEVNPNHKAAQERVPEQSHRFHNWAAEPELGGEPGPSAARAQSGAIPPSASSVLSHQIGIYEYLRSDPSPLAQQLLQLIDGLDALGTLTPRLIAHTDILRKIIALLLAPVVLEILFQVAISVFKLRGLQPNFEHIIMIVVIMVMIIPLVKRILFIKMYRVVFNEGRFRIASGILRRIELTYEIYRIEDIRVFQSLLNRVTGDGSLILIVSSQHSGARTLTFTGIAKIDRLREIADQLRNLVVLLRSSQIGKGVIY